MKSSKRKLGLRKKIIYDNVASSKNITEMQTGTQLFRNQPIQKDLKWNRRESQSEQKLILLQQMSVPATEWSTTLHAVFFCNPQQFLSEHRCRMFSKF